ncbi:hypothetical protein YC2023_049933 [Brassica napus]
MQLTVSNQYLSPPHYQSFRAGHYSLSSSEMVSFQLPISIKSAEAIEMTRVDLNVFSSSAADTESDPSVTINGLKPLSFRHRDGSTLAKTVTSSLILYAKAQNQNSCWTSCALLEEVCGWINAKAIVPV